MVRFTDHAGAVRAWRRLDGRPACVRGQWPRCGTVLTARRRHHDKGEAMLVATLCNPWCGARGHPLGAALDDARCSPMDPELEALEARRWELEEQRRAAPAEAAVPAGGGAHWQPAWRGHVFNAAPPPPMAAAHPPPMEEEEDELDRYMRGINGAALRCRCCWRGSPEPADQAAHSAAGRRAAPRRRLPPPASLPAPPPLPPRPAAAPQPWPRPTFHAAPPPAAAEDPLKERLRQMLAAASPSQRQALAAAAAYRMGRR